MAHTLERGDVSNMREHAHALKGVASNLGLVKLAASSGEMMRLPDAQVLSEWRHRLAILNANLSHGRAALEARARSKNNALPDKGERN